MKNLPVLAMAVAASLSCTAMAASYSTEATLTPLAEEGQYQVDVRVSRLTNQHGRLVEKLIARPKIMSGLGCPASYYQGLTTNNPDYHKQENIRVDVSWPYPGESGAAGCTVTIRQGDEVVSESKVNLQITGQGRTPLLLSAQNVDPKSVSVVTDKSGVDILLEFGGLSWAEAKKTAIANLGNQALVRDAAGNLVTGGIIRGTYHETGLTLQYPSESEARRVAGILGAGLAK